MELDREELLLTSFELPSHKGTKEDYFRAKKCIQEHENKVKEFLETVNNICKAKGQKVTTELHNIKKLEDPICIEIFKKVSACLTREEHIKLMDHWILEYLSKNTGTDIARIDDSSLSIFKKLYMKDRAIQQKEDLYLNRR